MSIEKAKNAYQVNERLKKHFQERFTPFSVNTINVRGLLDGKGVSVTYQPEFCLATWEGANDSQLKELQMVMSYIMNGEKPICKYVLITEQNGKKIEKPTVEWDSKTPDKRLEELIAGTAYEQAIVQDLVFLTEKNEMKEQSHPDRIYGIDPGSIRDIENVQKDGEVDLFHRIDELLTRIWYNNQVEKDQTENLEEQYALEYCIYQTTRFGVEIPEPVAHEHLTMTASYLAWFTFYHHYFHFMLTPDEQKEYYEKRKKGQDISKFIPQGNWQELIPCFRYCVQSNKNKQNIKTNVVA